MSDLILEMNHLVKKYKNIGALDDLSLTLKKGSIVGLLGPNGSGKTTLLKLIAGLLVPSEGDIWIDGMQPSLETKKIVSYLPDHAYLTDWMTIEQTLDYHQDFFCDFRRQRAEEMIDNLGLDPKRQIKTLSKGNKEKVALILSMSREAKLYLLDEPIAGVDPATRDYILHTIISNYQPNSTILISTHLISDVESILDDVVFIDKGQIRLHKSVDEIREQEGKSVDELFREVFRW